MLSNLLGNALAHTHVGGTVRVRTGRDRDMAFVDVVDDGDGIAAAELDRVFERFYSGPRVGSATSATARRGRGMA